MGAHIYSPTTTLAIRKNSFSMYHRMIQCSLYGHYQTVRCSCSPYQTIWCVEPHGAMLIGCRMIHWWHHSRWQMCSAFNGIVLTLNVAPQMIHHLVLIIWRMISSSVEYSHVIGTVDCLARYFSPLTKNPMTCIVASPLDAARRSTDCPMRSTSWP